MHHKSLVPMKRTLSLFALALTATAAQANPTGGQVVSGSATIATTSPNTLTINQSTSTASINWQDFSIASGETTRFVVPTSMSATLNRVTGGNISTIYGTLSSNGRLYLINPNGIVIGASGKIDTAGFLATTLNFSDAQFNQQADLTLSGNSTASVSNAGTIRASTGDVYLIAAQVNNSGKISAKNGTVGLAAGNSVLLQKSGDQHLFVQVNPTTQTAATGVSNSGSIRAAAAELKAAGGNAYALAINNTGNIKATGIKSINGQVYLTSDGGNISNSGMITAKQANGNGGTIVVNAHHNKATTQGTVLNSGTIAATGTAAGTTGGTVELLGDRVGVTDSGSVNVSGYAGGGTALIGGDEHGANAAVPDAEQTYIGQDATIDADALTLGNGGKVIVWGNETTQVYGAITARGGATGGNGGFVETSGAVLDVQKAVDVSAAKGQGGNWLLDPSDVTISDAVTDSGFSESPAFTLNSGTVTISQSTLLTALEGGDVTIDASTGSGGSGTITWNQSNGPMIVTDPGSHTLTLDAPVALTLNGVVVIANGSGGLNMVFNSSLQGAGSVNLQNSTLDLNGGNFTANGNGYQSLVDQNGEANGVNLFNSSINAAGGSINLTGIGGFANPGSGVSAGQGVGIFTGGSALTALSTTGTGSITISGSTGANITSTTPLIGVFLGHGMAIQAEDGLISITGAIGQGSTGVGTVADIDLVNTSTVQSTTSMGGIELTGSTAIIANGTLSAFETEIDSPVINLTGATVTTTAPGSFVTLVQGQPPVGPLGLQLVDDISGSTSGVINITNSTLNGTYMLIGNASGSNAATSQVNISGSSLQLVLGANPAQGSTLSLAINGTSNTAGAAGVSISNGSTITAVNGGAVSITGTGLLAAGSDATGVSIATSVISVGTPNATSGSLTITGTSDNGNSVLAPNTTFANNAYGINVSGSTITSDVTSGVTFDGTAFAANNLTSAGVNLSTNTSIQQTGAGTVMIDGTVLAETYANGVQGEANQVIGLQAISTPISAVGAGASIAIETDTHQATATDNGVNSVTVRNIGAYLEANTTLSASGETDSAAIPIQISGIAGAATAGSGNMQQTESSGLSIGGTGSGPVTITNSGSGLTILGGEGGAVTGGGGPIFSVGVLIGGSSATPAHITSTGGGSIGITGLGGLVAPNAHNSGQAVGVWSLFSNITTTTGEIAIAAFGGSTGGSGVPSDVTGLDLGSSVIQTGTGLAGSPPPLVLIYATADSLTSSTGAIATGTVTRVTGSADSFAVNEDTNSKIVTGNLVMGNYTDLASAYGAATLRPASLTLGQFITAVTGTGSTNMQDLATTPSGLIALISPQNQVTNLTAALDGSGGINFYNSTDLTVGTIGGTSGDGEVSGAGLGPVAITVAPNRNLTLTNTSVFTGDTNVLPVIATSGEGSQITLTTSGTGVFTNAAFYSNESVVTDLVSANDVVNVSPSGDGSGALVAEDSQYLIYANAPGQANLNGLQPTAVFNTAPGTLTDPDGNTIAYAVSESGTPPVNNNPGPTKSLSQFPSFKFVNDALYSIVPTQEPGGTIDPSIIGGAGGVASDGDRETDAQLKARLIKKFGEKRVDELLAIIREDAKDGSTVNTGTVGVKWASNTGLSRLVRIGEYGQLAQGLSSPQLTDAFILNLFQQQAADRHDMSQAASGTGAKDGHGP